jgi:hypothetical protein
VAAQLPLDHLEPGTAVGRYVVLERLGAGGMGVVYAAYDRSLDRKIALKILRRDRVAGAAAEARLLRAAQAMARLSHPHVAAVHHVGTLAGQVFVARELVDLEHLIEERRFRRDLYHRLAALVAVESPLRERPEDLPLLAGHFLRRELARNHLASPGMTGAALTALAGHSWPGSVRELENEIAKAVLLLERGETLDLAHLAPWIRASLPPEARPLSLEATVKRAEMQAFRAALARARGDPVRALQLLDRPRSTDYRKLKEPGLTEASPPAAPLGVERAR